MSEQGTPPERLAAKGRSPFNAGALLLVLCVLICGVFAGLAGKEIGNKNVDFAISFAFLGIVVIGIFGLAWIDSSGRGPGEGESPH